LNLYAESSAVLSWLFGESRGAAARNQLRRAELVLASDLTLVECERVIIRARALEEITEKKAQNCRRRLVEAANHWHILRIGADVIERSRLPFPTEPIRTLAALHLASALIVRSAVPDLAILTLDERFRAAAKEMRFAVLPKDLKS
jgi:predicted nucleic acid-binding protein